MSIEKNLTRKKSIGIALCRRARVPQILLIKSRTTYNFKAFVFGKYRPWDSDRILTILNNTTLEEKIILWTCDFEKMWHHVWLRVPRSDDEFYSFFLNCRTRFERFISKDSGKRFKSFISRATNTELGWEIPKGHPEPNETEMDCAVREMQEETGIDPTSYTILYNVTPLCDSHEDNSVVYISKYFVAWTKEDISLRIDFANMHQISEVSCIGWFGLKEIATLPALNKNLYRQCKTALKLFKIQN